MTDFLGLSGGRTRARTWDPLIKSQLLQDCVQTSDLAASTLFPKSRYQGAIRLNGALTACAVVVRFRDTGIGMMQQCAGKMGISSGVNCGCRCPGGPKQMGANVDADRGQRGLADNPRDARI